LDLDLHSSKNNYKTRTSPTGSSASPDSTDGCRSLRRLLLPRAWHTRSRELSALFGVWVPCLFSPFSTSTASSVSGLRRRIRLLRGLPLAARGPHAPSQTSPTPPPSTGLLLYLLFLCLFVCFIGLICCISLPQFIPVLVFGSLWLNTLVKSPLMVTPTFWHQCLKSKGPHLRKHCPRVLSFLYYILGCPSPPVFVFLIFCCNCFWCT